MHKHWSHPEQRYTVLLQTVGDRCGRLIRMVWSWRQLECEARQPCLMWCRECYDRHWTMYLISSTMQYVYSLHTCMYVHVDTCVCVCVCVYMYVDVYIRMYLVLCPDTNSLDLAQNRQQQVYIVSTCTCIYVHVTYAYSYIIMCI